MSVLPHGVVRGCSFGDERSSMRTAERLGLESTLHPRRHPKTIRNGPGTFSSSAPRVGPSHGPGGEAAQIFAGATVFPGDNPGTTTSSWQEFPSPNQEPVSPAPAPEQPFRPWKSQAATYDIDGTSILRKGGAVLVPGEEPVEGIWLPNPPAVPQIPSDDYVVETVVPPSHTVAKVASVALDIAGIPDPSGVADVFSAGLQLATGEFVGAALTLPGLLPIVGDSAKMLKVGMWVRTIREAMELAAKDTKLMAEILPHLEKVRDGISALGGRAPESLQSLGDDVGKFVDDARKRSAPRSGIGTTLNVLNMTCFVAGTPVLTPSGAKRIEEFKAGDEILSRPEDQPDAPVRTSVVEKLFELSAPVLQIGLGGRIIETTAEHPFFVAEKGWVPAENLEVGDLLVGHDDKLTRLDSLRVTERYEAVYNLRVAEDHTYFVGDDDWGFSVWVHNAYSIRRATDGTWEIIDSAGTVVKRGLSESDALAQQRAFNFGINGVQTPSHPVFNRSGLRIDFENPNPGQRAGQIHAQIGDEKYFYDPITGLFRSLDGTTPARSVLRILESGDAQRAIEKALRMLGEL